jgi:secondary thiamine-phosphate synthase enzyme
MFAPELWSSVRARQPTPSVRGGAPVAPPDHPQLAPAEQAFQWVIRYANGDVSVRKLMVRTLGTVMSHVLDIDTSRRGIVDLTDAVRSFCGGHGDGLCNVFVPHATAGVAIIETGAGSDDDLVDTLERLLPRDDRYRHAHGSPGHGADHVLPAIVAPSVSVPVQDGEPLLGTWQSVVLVDLNRDNRQRQVRLSFVNS